MIKFRCPTCGQKIAVNDEGAGVTIPCPNCAIAIGVPRETTLEFRAVAPRPTAVSVELIPPPPVLALGRIRHSQLSSPAQAVTETAATARASLMPHLARLMKDRLVQALFSQRAHLLDTQHAATQSVAELEQRLIKAQRQLQDRLAAYELRIKELERLLAIKEGEVRELRRCFPPIARPSPEPTAVKSALQNEEPVALLIHS